MVMLMSNTNEIVSRVKATHQLIVRARAAASELQRALIEEGTAAEVAAASAIMDALNRAGVKNAAVLESLADRSAR